MTKIVEKIYVEENELSKLLEDTKTLSGHNNSVRSVAITPDRKYIVSGSDDNTIKIWDFNSGKEIKTLSGHNNEVMSVAITPDEKYIVSGSADKTIKIWDFNSGENVKTLSGHNGSVYSVAITPDEKYIVSGSADNTIKIWDFESGKEIKTLFGHNSSVWSIAITPDGKYIVSGSGDKTIKIWDIGDITKVFSSNFMIKSLKKADKKRADLIEYDTKIFTDVNKGSWEVFENLNRDNFVNPVEISLIKPIVARDARADIVDSGVVGIDFGTKSTVVVYSKDKEKSLPMRVGIGDWSKKESIRDYENPTIMEFLNLSTFLKAYKEKEFRPNTKWKNLTISHRAYEDMKSAKSSQLNAFLTELKQWAGDNKRKLKIEDKNGNIFNLPSFEEVEEFNPIEIYAYYLGLYINNQFNGIYLNYLLSFPVTYDLKVRERILKSFEKGLKKSLPDIKEKIEDFRISGKVSEPVAYASVAIEEYELDEEEKSFYTIFDFGGGTCDFDFGIFRWADEKKEKKYDYVIESFGAGGDKFLGGENLLELLAFNIFKDNKDILLKENISFIKPPECDEFLGSEILLSDSREAKLNMLNLITKIRGFWEREEISEEYFKEEIDIDLYDNDGNFIQQILLKVEEEKLLNILRERIKKGVDSFFEALREAFFHTSKEINLDVDKIHILLAGNSSKSPIVKELFEEKIEEMKKEMGNSYNGEFILYPPLDNDGDFEKPNGKTGVAFGLIATRPGGRIKFIDRNSKKDDIKFKFYLGINRRKKFNVVVNREIEYNKWVEFIDAGEEIFEIYYTSSSLASTNKMKINDNSIKRKILKINKIDENLNIYIKVTSPNIFVYAVGDGKKFFDEKEVTLEEN